jgi:UDP-GlcNAc3NAcA epimerase
LKIATIVGARPQFIKASPISRAIVAHNRSESEIHELNEILIHTGQHYDQEMSGVFFETLGLPEPKYNLRVGSGSHGTQLAKMIENLEEVLKTELPDMVLLYGDTNSTLAGALMADRLHIPIAHVEAGLRSFNRRMPEECNRLIADHLSALRFAPTRTAVENLAREGIREGVHEIGDVMHEAAMFNLKVAESESTILDRLGLSRGEYSLATIHRAENTDDPVRLKGILEGLCHASKTHPLVWPVHPRTRKYLGIHQDEKTPLYQLLLTDPVSYRDMVTLENAARVILTDSGGVQKEADWFGVPCVTLREETEWVETVESGRNELAGCSPEKIQACFLAAWNKPRLSLKLAQNGQAPSALVVRQMLAFHLQHSRSDRPQV